MWPGGNDIALRVEGPEFDFGQESFSIRFFSIFSFSFRLVFFLVITVLLCFVPIIKTSNF